MVRPIGYISILLRALLTAVALGAVAAGPTTTTTAPQADPKFHVDLHRSVEYLASDALEGRMIGTPGIERAADYIADTFGKLGLDAAPGLQGYFQPFTMITAVNVDAAKTLLAIDRHVLKLDEEFRPLRASPETAATGAIAFAGYGIDDAARDYNDYAGLDVKGKIVLIMRFEPHTPEGKSRFARDQDEWSNDATIPAKVQTAQAHEAAGVMLVNPPLHHDAEPLMPFARRIPFKTSIPVLQISGAAAEAILKAGGAPDLKALQTRIDQAVHPQSMALSVTSAHMEIAFNRIRKTVNNVVGVLPGRGPDAGQYVVVGAHYDHLGHGGPGSLAPWSHGIHHGADDNASGTTTMMALADHFAHAGPQPRTLVFVAFGAEEEGLIGSEYFVSNPPIPLDHVIAMLNLDMVGRVTGNKLLIGGEGTAGIFPKLVEQADVGLPFQLGEFGRGGIGPSDHSSFALHRIPVLFFFSGLHLDYHRPTDTADKINYQGMADVVKLGVRVIHSMTTMPPQKYNGSYDASGLTQLAGPGTSTGTGGPASRASLGAIPDYAQGEDARGGMRIGGVMPNSPADKAGLRQGDVVTDFGNTRIDNMMDYTEALGKARPAQPLKLKILRGGKPIEIDVTPVERKD